MEKLDLRKTFKTQYSPSAKQAAMVEIPTLQFLMIDGEGDPNTAPAYQQALQALYSVAYALKFAEKKAGRGDWSVMPLEGLWWADDPTVFAADSSRDDWHWTMMIAQPDLVTAERVGEVVAEVARKKALPALEQIRLESYNEGLCAQIMHLGPYAAEGPTIAGLHAYIAEQGYALRGKHHEIYLGDPNRTASEKLKTILRQPVARP